MIEITSSHEAIHKGWQEVLDSGVFTEGRFVRDFEAMVTDRYGMEAIAFNSAGSGLFAVMCCLELGKGGLALVPNNTFYATGAMVRESGLTPVLVDCNKDDFCLSREHVSALRKDPLLVSRHRATLLTHVGGGIAKDLPHFTTAAEQTGWPLVEDAAHALGIGYGKIGQAGAAVFSLYPTKALPVGDGGIVITNRPQLAEALRRFRNYGKHKSAEGDMLYDRGFNLRMDEWTAVVAYHQFKEIDAIIDRRTTVADKIKKIVAPLVSWEEGETNWYKFIAPADYPAKVQAGKVYNRADQLDRALKMPNQPALPNSKWVAENHICLPVYEAMHKWTVAEIEAYLMTGEQP